MRSLDIDYNIASFFRDIAEIRARAFRDSRMWPINPKEALKKMKVYAPPERLEEANGIPCGHAMALIFARGDQISPYLTNAFSAAKWAAQFEAPMPPVDVSELEVIENDPCLRASYHSGASWEAQKREVSEGGSSPEGPASW
jgi:hypothetical protein